MGQAKARGILAERTAEAIIKNEAIEAQRKVDRLVEIAVDKAEFDALPEAEKARIKKAREVIQAMLAMSARSSLGPFANDILHLR